MSKSEPYNGPISAMRKSPFLASEDIDGLGDIDAEIEGVYRDTDVQMADGRKEKEIYTLKFKGRDKRMCLNATNIKTLSRAFGADIKKWVGQKVKLYIQDGVKAFGSTTRGLRVKVDSRASQQQKSSDAANSLTDKINK